MEQIMVKSVFILVLVALLMNSFSSTASAAPNGASAAASAAAAPAGLEAAVNPLAGVQGLFGGALNMASMPLNTLTAGLNSLGLPTFATAPLNAFSSLFQQAGGAYGR